MSAISDIERGISAALRPVGFARSRRNWRRVDEEIVQVVNLQKSQYGDQCFLNIGFFLRQLDPDVTAPVEHRCHVRLRGNELWEPSRSVYNLHAVLAPSYEQLPHPERMRLLDVFLFEDLLPVLERGRTVDALVQLVTDGALPELLLVLEARRVLLGESPPEPSDPVEFPPIADFDEQYWTGGRWQHTEHPVEPWLRVDVHDSDFAEVTFAPVEPPARGRFFVGIHPVVYFGTAPESPPEDPAIEAPALAAWAERVTDTRVDADEVGSFMATTDGRNEKEDVFVEETLERLLDILLIGVPDVD